MPHDLQVPYKYAFGGDSTGEGIDLTEAWTYSSYLTITKKDDSKFKVYIDGRTNILYPIEFTKRFAALYGSKDFSPVSDEIDSYNIEFAIYPINLASH